MKDPKSVRRKACSDCNSIQSVVEPGRLAENGTEFADNPGLNLYSATTWTSYIISLGLSFRICKMGRQGCFAEVLEITCTYRSEDSYLPAISALPLELLNIATRSATSPIER